MERSPSPTWLPAGSQEPPRAGLTHPLNPFCLLFHTLGSGWALGTATCTRRRRGRLCWVWRGCPPSPDPRVSIPFPRAAAFLNRPGGHTPSSRGPTSGAPQEHSEPASVQLGREGGGASAPFQGTCIPGSGNSGERGAESRGQALGVLLLEARLPIH